MNFGEQAAFGDDQVDQSKQGVELSRVFGQPPVAGLAVVEEVLEDARGKLFVLFTAGVRRRTVIKRPKSSP
jgi:hypothetical protein